MEFFRNDPRFVDDAGRKFEFAWTCSYMGEIDYRVTDETGTYTARIRRTFGDYERSICNGPDVVRECETSIGILRRCVGANRGEVAPATIDAFNAWLAREHGAVIAFMKARPDRYGDPAELDRNPMFAAPAPVVGGFWEKGNGWTRRDPTGAVALAA